MRQKPSECALFALCSYSGYHYETASKLFVRRFGTAWGNSLQASEWAQFSREVLLLDIEPQFFTGINKPQNVLWNQDRFVFSHWFGGSTHIAYANCMNVVDDGMLSETVSFPQYARLLGERGGMFSGYVSAPKRLHYDSER